MTILSLRDFMKKKDLKKTMNQYDLQRIYNYSIYPRGSKIYLDKGYII